MCAITENLTNSDNNKCLFTLNLLVVATAMALEHAISAIALSLLVNTKGLLSRVDTERQHQH